jgi:hypothetical protein
VPDCRIDWDGGTIEATTSPDAQRRAAEWALSVGGKIGMNEKPGGVHEMITRAKDLPAGPLRITCVDLHNLPEISNADLARLKSLTNLTHLNLHTLPQVNDTGLGHLRTHTKLHDLHIYTCPVTDAGLAHLKGLVELDSLALGGPEITDDGLKHLVDLPKLRRLLMLAGTATGDKVLVLLKAHPQVRIFSPGMNFTNDGMRGLRAVVPELSQLHLVGGTKVTDAGLEHLKGWNSIEWLRLDGPTFTDGGLQHLAGLKNLNLLQLYKTRVTADGVAALRKALPDCNIQWDGEDK